jgi:hypothetical protein
MTEPNAQENAPQPGQPEVAQEYIEETPTPPSGLSLEARDWQLSDDEDVQELDFNQFRSDR